ncbi:hypothetical protein RGQ13_08130 [Thalassotalea psychrophila]|uniref:ABC transporter substrate-binding protein n=1 Tax=Thalassotalea psychrophila TaxID=3065647 RepID=A0ABY9TZE9_9GAMM|nr:hypothetical protein RGQ13_08130 [Colwelliaceae bacterium SQ149]
MTTNVKFKSLATAVIASVLLTACGGGGGGSSEPKTITPPPPPAETKLVWDSESAKWNEVDWQ